MHMPQHSTCSRHCFWIFLVLVLGCKKFKLPELYFFFWDSKLSTVSFKHDPQNTLKILCTIHIIHVYICIMYCILSIYITTMGTVHISQTQGPRKTDWMHIYIWQPQQQQQKQYNSRVFGVDFAHETQALRRGRCCT